MYCLYHWWSNTLSFFPFRKWNICLTWGWQRKSLTYFLSRLICFHWCEEVPGLESLSNNADQCNLQSETVVWDTRRFNDFAVIPLLMCQKADLELWSSGSLYLLSHTVWPDKPCLILSYYERKFIFHWIIISYFSS